MKILYVTTISLTMNTFFKPHVEMLVKEGYEVDIACNYSDLSLHDLYNKLGCKIYQIDFSRSPFSLGNIKAIAQLKDVIKNGNYDIVHCHTPNASVITRLVCRKFRNRNGLKVFYTAHGFHFYKGAPKLNWMIYYPIEKCCSRFTDKLITITTEDYELAKMKFKANEVHYVPGVGIDLSRFENVQVDRNAKRREIGVPEDAFLLLSVGELNENKNHQVIIKAIANLNDATVHYAIAGVGDKKEFLLDLTKELGVEVQVHLLGFRRDIEELYKATDVFCFPSFREGLSASLMEAMASGLPCIISRIRGSTDLINEESGFLCDTDDVGGFATAISNLMEDKELCLKMGKTNKERSHQYSIGTIIKAMKSIYPK